MSKKGSCPTGRETAPPRPTIQNPKSQSKKAPRPNVFQSVIFERLNIPYTGLFRLWVRFLQLCFALGSGISYAIELAHGNNSPTFIYSQIAFGLTLIILVVDATTMRSYRLTFIVEWTLCILWLALFGVCYVAYLGNDGEIDPEFAGVNISRMKRAVWINLVNFLLWMGSAIFSTVLCYVGVKATVRWKWNHWRANRKSKDNEQAGLMEKGVVREPLPARSEERLPTYNEVPVIAQ